MTLSPAYLLISHGSRDQRPQLAMEKLVELVHEKLETRKVTGKPPTSYSHDSDQIPNLVDHPLVGTAVLEHAYAPLSQQIQQFSGKARAIGCNKIELLPIFLLPGVHVMEDIPQEVALAQASLGQAAEIRQLPHLGSHPGLTKMLVSQLVEMDADAKILLSHGTRRPGGNEPVEAVADYLGAMAAYLSVPPMLEEQVKVLAAAGHKQIVILPYFFFCGSITDAIAQLVADLQLQFPKLELKLGQPIGASTQLADLIVDLVEQI
ncbi:CbiX/SirB N-terminal domain-containing protein [Lyngbya aestuarii]|uniref:CbiX/SirB N-terminal domain-containing protein n=1 Tax=Lyngbya aestuarii TaxID=118322 RepID=UPI00403E02EE